MKTLDLLDEKASINKTILLLAWPTIIEQILLTCVNYIDTAMVGSLGAVATAAVSLNSSVILLVNGLLMALAVGYSVIVAKNIGSENYERSRMASNQGILIALLVGFVIFVVMLFLGPNIPFILGADSSVISDSQDYIKYLTIAFIPQGLMIMSSGIFRASGDTKTPFLVNILNNIINVVLNFMLIFPSTEVSILGLSFTLKRANLGVKGAAIATCLAICTSSILIVSLLARSKDNRIKIKIMNPLKMDWDINKKASFLALPNAFERFSMALGQFILTAIVTSLGVKALASHYLAIQAESITYMPTFGFATAATTLVAQAIGAKKINLAKKYARNSLIMGTLVMSIAGLFLFIFAHGLVDFFTNDVEVIESGAQVLRIVAICEPFFGMSMMVFGILRGSGDTKRPFIITLIGMWIIRLPLAYLVVNYTSYGLNGAWTVMTFDLIVRGVISFIIYRQGKFFNNKNDF